MKCKNCSTLYPEPVNYCSSCGAKAVDYRFTFKLLANEFTERVFNIENNFFRTFKDLLLHPEKVILSYIKGTRKRYLNPLSYIGIALTLSGVLLFLMQKIYIGDLDMEGLMGNQLPAEVSEKILNFTMDLSSFLFLAYIPIFAIASYLALNKKQLNLAEHTIANIYLLAQWSMLTFPISLLALIFAPSVYFNLAFPMLIAMFLYAIYTNQRIHEFSIAQLILRSIAFLILIFIGYLGILILNYGLMFATGVLTPADFGF